MAAYDLLEDKDIQATRKSINGLCLGMLFALIAEVNASELRQNNIVINIEIVHVKQELASVKNEKRITIYIPYALTAAAIFVGLYRIGAFNFLFKAAFFFAAGFSAASALGAAILAPAPVIPVISTSVKNCRCVPCRR